jgi:hypothetical protein
MKPHPNKAQQAGDDADLFCTVQKNIINYLKKRK